MSGASTNVFHVAHPADNISNGHHGQGWDGVDAAIDSTKDFVKRTAGRCVRKGIHGRKVRDRGQPITRVSGRNFPDILHTSTGHVFASGDPEKTQEKLKDELQFGAVGGSSARGFHLAEKTFEEVRDGCLASGKLYEDPDFPAVDSSLFWFSRLPIPITWKRPSEIVKDPRMYRDENKHLDVVQGQLGDCWLMAAMSDLACRPDQFLRVCPTDQGFSKEEKYCGAFHFKFWRFGRWVDVVVDDRLPTHQGRLVYTHSGDLQEFWPALMEKAYAKVNGCYENLDGGTASEAMEDLTGGIAEHYELKSPPKNLMQIVEQSFKMGALMSSAIAAEDSVRESRLTNGLVLGHAYSLTDVRTIPVSVVRGQSATTIMRARNPWGQQEWNGPFSDKSSIWNQIPQNIKDDLHYSISEDGEFWLDYQDFQTNYQLLEICNVGPEAFLVAESTTAGQAEKTGWNTNVFEGAWTKGVTAGGCRNNAESFFMNPQYRLVISSADAGTDGLATCIVALMQKDRRKLRIRGDKNLPIGYGIYFLKEPATAPTPLPKDFFLYNASVAKSPVFMNSREVVTRFRMPPGTYIIVPSTYAPDQEGTFLLRVYTEVVSEMHEHDVHVIEQLKDLTIVPKPARDPKLEAEVLELYKQVADDNFTISVQKFQDLLNRTLIGTPTATKKVSREMARSLMALSDVHQSGKLDASSFMQLLTTVRYWKTYFDKYDPGHTGLAKLSDLRGMFEAMGCKVNNNILRVVALRYAEEDQKTINLESFIMGTVRLQQMMNLYRTKDPNLNGTAAFNLEEWIINTMYN
ncbi:Calpain-B [Hypsibius exemplaris]|uniref:Calpain-B n=1 Tax=Hypsibius exemplaris TaxID=2072580 RepID=A0A1W0WGZ8_HYPEX|nr:Calpain-B [Hypsibius exemplaris]